MEKEKDEAQVEEASHVEIKWENGSIVVDTNVSAIGAIHLMALAQQVIIERNAERVAKEAQ